MYYLYNNTPGQKRLKKEKIKITCVRKRVWIKFLIFNYCIPACFSTSCNWLVTPRENFRPFRWALSYIYGSFWLWRVSCCWGRLLFYHPMWYVANREQDRRVLWNFTASVVACVYTGPKLLECAIYCHFRLENHYRMIFLSVTKKEIIMEILINFLTLCVML